MAADRIITCTNEDGDSVIFSETRIFDFILVDADGLYDVSNEVQIMKNTMVDGGIYQNSIAGPRNIVLTVCDWRRQFPIREQEEDDENDTIYITSGYIKGSELKILSTQTLPHGGSECYVQDRDLLNRVFKSGRAGRLEFQEDGETRVIDYYVESMTSTGKDSARTHTISLICPDPFFYDPADIHVYLARLMGDFSFMHEFTEAGETLGHIVGAYEDIYNASANDGVGLTISITGTTQIINPVVTRLESNEHIGIGTEEDPFTLGIGEQIIFTTGTGNKHAYYVHDGVTEEVNYLLIDDSSFIQLRRGDNSIGFDAYDGKNTMLVELIYRMQYARA